MHCSSSLQKARSVTYANFTSYRRNTNVQLIWAPRRVHTPANGSSLMAAMPCARVSAGAAPTNAVAAVGSADTVPTPPKAGDSSQLSTPTMPDIVVYTTPGCQYCRQAKAELLAHGLPYLEVDVSNDAALRAALREASGARTVPQIFAAGTLIGGSEALAAALADGRMSGLLALGAPRQLLPPALAAAAAAVAARATADEAVNADTDGGFASATTLLPPELTATLAALSDPITGVPRPTHRASTAAAGAAAGRGAPAFRGTALLDWLQQHGNADAAREVAAALLRANAVSLLSDQLPPVSATAVLREDALYCLTSEAPARPAWGEPLNARYWWGPAPPRPAPTVAEDLRRRILALYDRHLASDGRGVHYSALADDPDFWAYADAAAELQRVDLTCLSRAELMCFAINTYNALVIHALVVHGTAAFSSSTGRLAFFQKAARYVIGGSTYTLDDLENGILRGNRPAASSLGMLLGIPALSRRPFRAADPRASAVVPDPLDARVHFALVCGAKSCPPIKLYSPAMLDEGLAAAAEAFCAADIEVDVPTRTVRLSKIFQWYSPDFGANKAERLCFLLPHLPRQQAADIHSLLADDPHAARVRVMHKPYDWGVNDADTGAV